MTENAITPEPEVQAITAESEPANTEEAKPEGAGEEPRPEEEAKEPEEKPKPKIDKRLNKVLAQKAQLEQQNREYQERLAKYEAEKAKAAPKPDPILETEAYEKWAEEQATTKAKAESLQRETESRLRANWEATSRLARAVHDDFDEVLDMDVLNGIPRHIATALVGSDEGAEILYYFGKHPEEQERFLDLNEKAMGRELIALVQKLKAPVPKKIVSSAPAPISPVQTNSRAEKDPEKMSMEEFKAWREAQLKRA